MICSICNKSVTTFKSYDTIDCTTEFVCIPCDKELTEVVIPPEMRTAFPTYLNDHATTERAHFQLGPEGEIIAPIQNVKGRRSAHRQKKEKKMPVKACQEKGKPGYKYGDAGKCYTYTPGNAASKNRAFNAASKQGRAIKANE